MTWYILRQLLLPLWTPGCDCRGCICGVLLEKYRLEVKTLEHFLLLKVTTKEQAGADALHIRCYFKSSLEYVKVCFMID